MSSNEGNQLSRKAFMDLLTSGSPTTKAPAGKADWDEIFKKATKLTAPITIRDFYAKYVKGVVTRQRAKNVLDALFDKKKVARIYEGGRYYYSWDPEMISLQHAEE